jgi:phospholipid/cholesterol/gamma-HCH transport system substrate-binding protein
MEPKAHHVLIGMFVLLCSGAALLFALWLSDAETDREYAYYVVCFDQTVSGLAEGNAVLYNGIKVGDVIKLGLNPDDPRQVQADIRVYSDIPIKEDTTATLSLTNITGSMSIQLRGGTPQSPVLHSDPKDPALIRAQPSSLSALLANGEDLVEQVGLLLTQANHLFSKRNVDNISAILVNIEQLSSDLAGQGDRFASAIDSVDRAALEARQTFADFAEVGASARNLLDGDASAMLSSARASMQGLEKMVQDVQMLLDSHGTSLERGFQGIGELEPVMRELRATMENLQRITARLEENPADFILGNGSVQEFSP